MTRKVTCLEEGGYVARRAHETDGRVVVVSLTEQGRATVSSPTASAATSGWPAQLRDLTPEERAVLRAAAPIIQRLSEQD